MKNLTLGLLLILTLAFTACGSTEEAPAADETAPMEEAEPTASATMTLEILPNPDLELASE